MLIAQISDCHILPPGVLAYGRYDTSACLRACLQHLATLRPVPELVLVTGDVAEEGSAESYRHAREILAVSPAPVFVMPGNHDEREAMRAAFAADGYLPARGPLNYVVDAGAVRVVALDTLVPGEPGGRLDAESLDWLEGTLAEAPERPTLVALHHPPLASGIAHMDAMALAEPDGLAAVLRRHRQVERVVFGHLHRALISAFAGTVAVACPSTCHQLALDLRAKRGVAIAGDPPGFLLHQWRPGQGMVSHVGTVPDARPPAVGSS